MTQHIRPRLICLLAQDRRGDSAHCRRSYNVYGLRHFLEKCIIARTEIVSGAPPTRHDLRALAANYRSAVNPPHLERLAAGLGLAVDSLNRLGAGWSYDCGRPDALGGGGPTRGGGGGGGAWAFPMRAKASTSKAAARRSPA